MIFSRNTTIGELWCMVEGRLKRMIYFLFCTQYPEGWFDLLHTTIPVPFVAGFLVLINYPRYNNFHATMGMEILGTFTISFSDDKFLWTMGQILSIVNSQYLNR